jgi:hypothetical protein
MQKMVSKGQIGTDLKGINKNILDKIEHTIAPCLENEKNLYQTKVEFTQKTASLNKNLQDYRASLRASLSSLWN